MGWHTNGAIHGQGLELRELPDWPAAMNQQTAAAYCGLSVDAFSKVCPVKPIAITSAKSGGKRYLKYRIDEWRISLDVGTSAAGRA